MWRHACKASLALTPSEVQTQLSSKVVQNLVIPESEKINYAEEFSFHKIISGSDAQCPQNNACKIHFPPELRPAHPWRGEEQLCGETSSQRVRKHLLNY